MKDTRKYETFKEFLLDVDRETSMSMPDRASRKTNNLGWYGGVTWEEALYLARNGWEDGRKIVGEITENLYATVRDRIGEIPVPVIAGSVSGFAPNVPAYLAGFPEAMFTWQENDKPTRIVRVLMDACVSAGFSAAQIRLRGAGVCALIDLMESSRRVRCEVVVMAKTGNMSYNPTDIIDHRILVKRPESSLQMDQLAFTLAHPAMLRRMFFNSWETTSRDQRRNCNIEPDYGYGCVQPVVGEEDGDIVVPGMLYGDNVWDNKKSVQDWIVRTLIKNKVILS